jgi:hypothetical protein
LFNFLLIIDAFYSSLKKFYTPLGLSNYKKFITINLLECRDIAQLGRAPALGAGCRRFKSYYPETLVTINLLKMVNLFKFYERSKGQFLKVKIEIPYRIIF